MAHVFSSVYFFAAFRLSNVNGLRFRRLMGMRMNGAIVLVVKAIVSIIDQRLAPLLGRLQELMVMLLGCQM